MDCFAALAMTEDIVPRSRGADRARVVGRTTLRNQRGRGECRVPNAPAASCAPGSWSMHTSIHSGGTGNIRHSPRNGFTAYIALSPGTGLSCPRRFVDHPAKLNASVG